MPKGYEKDYRSSDFSSSQQEFEGEDDPPKSSRASTAPKELKMCDFLRKEKDALDIGPKEPTAGTSFDLTSSPVTSTSVTSTIATAGEKRKQPDAEPIKSKKFKANQGRAF